MDIIANLGSGKGNGKKCLEKVKATLDARSIAYNVHETNAVGHGKQLARVISEQGSDEGAPRVIVALGGDGTFHEVLNGIDFEKARMGLIPAGRGNDFAIGTGAASLDPEIAISDIVCGKPREIDYINVSDKRCLNVAGTGLDVEVLLKTAKSKNKLTYTASLFKCLLRYKPYHVEVTANGETKGYDCIMAGVCNGTQIGGGIRLAPIAVADDGLLDIIIMEKPKRVPTVFIMPRFVKGKHMNKPYTNHFKCEHISIDTPAPLQLDGEIYYDLKFDASVQKGGVKTFASSVVK
ncbi:MAG: YegS/Rv2252/BmrU family lipid kinase [Clostridiales bacterium]|nr:YegS/Rv2252/BmrU family lipid kinase [Clostridiales bacterium]